MKNILPYESTSKAIKNYDDSAIAKKKIEIVLLEHLHLVLRYLMIPLINMLKKNLDVKTDKEHMVHHLKCKNLQKIEHK